VKRREVTLISVYQVWITTEQQHGLKHNSKPQRWGAREREKLTRQATGWDDDGVKEKRVLQCGCGEEENRKRSEEEWERIAKWAQVTIL
jgi:hypothetical protein